MNMDKKKIFKISLALVRDNKYLMLKEKGISFLKNPGGKPEAGETEEQTLRRELMEELDVELKNIKHLGVFENMGGNGEYDMIISAYMADVVGELRLMEEVEELVWVSADDPRPDPVSKDIINALVDKGYMKRDDVEQKVNALVVRDGQLLAELRFDTDFFIIPGGGPEGNETHEQALKREMMEELSVDIENMRFFGIFDGKSLFSDKTTRANCYLVDIVGEPVPANEIVEIKWIDSSYAKHGIRLGSILEKQVLPLLIKKGLVK
jgi:8-oxo-dGTP pyrophosphatase MutT (NUDIX family)